MRCIHENQIDSCDLCNKKREWVDLTWDEIYQLSIGIEGARFKFARAVEAKVKEKNYDKT
jgi:hypothetical protein